MSIEQNEKRIKNQILNTLGYYTALNEDSGHPLFKYGNPSETFDWIERIKNSINVINDKIKNGKIEGRYKTTFNNSKRSIIFDQYYPISLSLNKLGFKEHSLINVLRERRTVLSSIP